jgi:SAM-dependent methyltransferase
MNPTEDGYRARIERAAERFADQPGLYYYARGKMGLDPAYPLLARLLREERQPIWDLGCGGGIFAAYLRESGVTAPIFGVDLAKEKIRLAQERVAGSYPGMEFAVADLADWVREPNRVLSGSVVMLDALHYFSTEKQAELLRNLAEKLPPGARLYLRNGVRDAGWRFACTLAEEGFVRLSRWITGGDCQFPTRGFVEQALRRAGLVVVTVPLWGRTPFSSLLFTAARPA